MEGYVKKKLSEQELIVKLCMVMCYWTGKCWILSRFITLSAHYNIFVSREHVLIGFFVLRRFCWKETEEMYIGRKRKTLD